MVKSIQTIDQSTSFVINYHLVGVTGIVEFRKRTIDDRAGGIEDQKAAACKMRTLTKYSIRNNSLQKNFRAFNFRGWGHPRKFFNNENFPIYGIYCYSWVMSG